MQGGAAKEQNMLRGIFIGIDVSKARLDVAFRPGGDLKAALGVSTLVCSLKPLGDLVAVFALDTQHSTSLESIIANRSPFSMVKLQSS
jgi:hypothetical protein